MAFDVRPFREKKLPAGPLLLVAAVSLVVLNAADFALTQVGLEVGGTELNLLFAGVATTWWGFALKTVGVALVSGWVYFALRNSYHGRVFKLFLGVVWFYLAVVMWNAIQLSILYLL